MADSANIMGGDGKRRQVDELDVQIIRLLQEQPRASYAELARTAGIPESTFRRRADNLFSSRVISPAIIPDVAELGYAAWTVVGLNVDLNHLDDLVEALREQEQVTMVFVTLGRYDIIIGIAARTASEVHHYIVNHIAPLPGVKNSESFMTASIVKILRDWRVPFDGLETQYTRPDS